MVLVFMFSRAPEQLANASVLPEKIRLIADGETVVSWNP